MTYPLGDRDELLQCLDEFEVALEQLARRLARAVIADEHARRRRAQPRVAAARSSGRREPTAPPPAVAIEPLEPVAAAPGKRTKWTREAVIAELCEWLISGIVEPAFLRRHGKPGLVAAATRIFGRFDSALNVANLYLAKQYPDGPPAKRRPAIAAQAPRSHAPEPLPAEPDAAPNAAASDAIAPEPAASNDEPAPDPAHVN